jgi:hypothetical protein
MSKTSAKKDAYDWEKIIDDAISREDWFSGFTNSVTYFEHWAYWRLHWYFIKNKLDIRTLSKKLSRSHVSNLILILYILQAIDKDTYSRINKIISERNKLVHPAREGLSYRDRKEKDRAIELLNDAKNCIAKIKEEIAK